MSNLECPECHEISTDRDFDEGTEKCAVWSDMSGDLNCECWECGKEWVNSK